MSQLRQYLSSILLASLPRLIKRNRHAIYDTIRQEFRHNAKVEVGSTEAQKKIGEALQGLKQMRRYRGMGKSSHIEYNMEDGSGFSNPASSKLS